MSTADTTITPSAPRAPLAHRTRPRKADALVTSLAVFASGLVLITMALIAWKVTDEAQPAISEFGLSFLTTNEWNAVTNQFGAADLIWGTMVTSLFALVLAVPLSLAIALFLSELAPRRLRTPVGMLVELLAAIPSVVLGLWGILVMGPFLQQHIEPWLADHFGFIPLFSGTPSNVGLLPACLVLTIMIVPIVSSISRELFAGVPSDLKSGALALGATRWEMVRKVVIPHVSGGLVAATMLGFARAAGEAIAVAMVIGGTASRSIHLFAPADTLAARLANQYAGAATAMQTASLAFLAVLLLIISVITNVIAQIIVGRVRRNQRGTA
jgi:phosphate transport system permease protein